MRNLPRKIWNTEAGQKQREADRLQRKQAIEGARTIRALRGFAVVEVGSFKVRQLEKKTPSKNVDFSFMKQWFKSVNNLIQKVKVKFSAKKDVKTESEYMVDPVTGLAITKQKWQELADRANVKTPEATITYKAKHSDSLTQKTQENALQSDLDVSHGKTIQTRTVPVPGKRKRKVIEEDSDNQ